MTREDFNKKYEGIVKEISRLDNSNETFNIFKILGLTDYEIRHSNFLAWLLKNEIFFKKFIELYNNTASEAKMNKISGINFNDEIQREINREEHFKEDEKNGRYIDLNIIGSDFTITIENKIDTEEHDSQCIAYRNYVEKKYKGKNHYYVFLGKKEPDDFNSDLDGKYPEYIFINYEQIRNILFNSENKFGFDNIQKVIVKHYISVIDEWKKIPDEYVKSLTKFEKEKEEDLSIFTDRKSLNGIKLTQEEERFVELAKRYYTQKKEDVDKIIKPAVALASQESYFMKTEYGRGNYAVAIPLSPEVFNYKEKKTYLEQQYLSKKKSDSSNVITEDEIEEIKKYNEKLDKEEKKTLEKLMDSKIKMISKKKNCIPRENNWAFQTVDYRAPMEGLNNPSIGIIAGLSKDYSIKLCEYLKDNEFIKNLDNLTDWSKELRFYWKNGSGYNKNSNGIECNYDVFKSNRIEILKKDIHGKKENIFNKEFENYFKILEDINLLDSNEFSKWKGDLRNYFSNGGKCVYFGWSLSLKYEIKDFDEKYKNDINALKNLFIEKTLEGVAPFGDEYKDWYKTEVFQN